MTKLDLPAQIDTPLFTVLTPTYNRSHTLGRLYESLAQQTFRDFEWLVIDDGSNDSTCETIGRFKAEATFPVRYVWQENGHKKAAVNHGIRVARGRLVTIIDSDDQLLPDALWQFHKAWETIPQSEKDGYCGIRALCVDESGEIVGDLFPNDSFDATNSELAYRYKIGGEKFSCERRDVLERNLFPDDIEGFVSEQVMWSKISKQYKYLCINTPVRIYHESPDSISGQLVRTEYYDRCEGLVFTFSHTLNHDSGWFFRNPWYFVKTAANRTRFLLHYKKSRKSKKFPLSTIGAHALSIAFGWIGVPLYIRDILKIEAAKRRMQRVRT